MRSKAGTADRRADQGEMSRGGQPEGEARQPPKDRRQPPGGQTPSGHPNISFFRTRQDEEEYLGLEGTRGLKANNASPVSCMDGAR